MTRKSPSPEPTTNKMAEAIKWSKQASRATDRPFSAGGFQPPHPATYLTIRCKGCTLHVDVVWDNALVKPTCPSCGTKLINRTQRSVFPGNTVIGGTAYIRSSDGDS